MAFIRIGFPLDLFLRFELRCTDDSASTLSSREPGRDLY